MIDATTTVRNALTEDEATSERSADAVFEALSHRYRRFALIALRDSEGPVALADLAVDVTKQETGDAREGLSMEQAREIEISLYHVHVPKLDAAGIVEFDRDRNTVTLPDETAQSVCGMA